MMAQPERHNFSRIILFLGIVHYLLCSSQMALASSLFQSDLKVSDLIEVDEGKAKNFTVSLANADPPMDFPSTPNSLPVFGGPVVLFKANNSDAKLELRFVGGTGMTVDQIVAPAIELCNFMHGAAMKPGASNKAIVSVGPAFDHIDKIGTLQVKGETLKYVLGQAGGKQTSTFFGVIKPKGCNEVVVTNGEIKAGQPDNLNIMSAMLSSIDKFKSRRPNYPHYGMPAKTESLEEKANHLVKMKPLPAGCKVTEVYLLPPSFLVQHAASGQKILVLVSTKSSPDPAGAIERLASWTKENMQPKRVGGNMTIDLGPIQNGAPFKSIKKKSDLDLPIGKMAYLLGTASDGSERFVGLVDTKNGGGLDIIGMQAAGTVYDLSPTKQFLEQIVGLADDEKSEH
jgi:hypothetical protein